MGACIGDLLSWSTSPTRDAALRGYIIKSRVKKADHILLAQPYHPQLFMQGALPGADLLLKALCGDLSYREVRQAWKDEESKRNEDTSETKEWYEKTMIPCRRCTDKNKGQEIRKFLSAFYGFLFSHKPADYWDKVVSQGADAHCLRCKHSLGWIVSNLQKSRNFIV